MVEFSELAPKPPEKKFLKSMAEASESTEIEIPNNRTGKAIESQPTSIVPQLPRKLGRLCFEGSVLFPRQDSTYTALKPNSRFSLSLPPEFVIKAAVRGGLLGLQGGRVYRLDFNGNAVVCQGAGNRNISSLTVDAAGSVLIQHNSGQLFSLQEDALLPLFKTGLGTMIARPNSAQIFLISGQETLIIQDGALLSQKLPSHFAAFQFVSAEEIAVVRGGWQVDLYALSASLQPVSLGHLELAIEHGQLLKCIKIGEIYVTVQVEGRLTCWNLKQKRKILVPLSVNRISSVLLDSNSRLWIGLQSGVLLVVEVGSGLDVMAELKAHEAAITRIYEERDTILSIDSDGKVCIWDRLLQKYQASKYTYTFLGVHSLSHKTFCRQNDLVEAG
jgi:hypothetical protein